MNPRSEVLRALPIAFRPWGPHQNLPGVLQRGRYFLYLCSAPNRNPLPVAEFKHKTLIHRTEDTHNTHTPHTRRAQNTRRGMNPDARKTILGHLGERLTVKALVEYCCVMKFFSAKYQNIHWTPKDLQLGLKKTLDPKNLPNKK